MIQFTKTLLVFLLMLLISQTGLYAKAYFAPKNEMIKEADVIVIADIVNVEKTEMISEHWTYGQKATAKVEQVIKGKVDQEIIIYGMEDFICAQCRYEKGKFLLFLKYDKDLLIGSNWNYSIRPIKDKSVEWYKKDYQSIFEFEYLPLTEVIKEIESKLQK